MKHTIIAIVNRDLSKSRVLSFKGDISIIVTASFVRVCEMLGIDKTRYTDIPLLTGQAVSIRNWGTK